MTDAAANAWARARYGVITRRELHRAGVTSDAIRHRVETGRLVELHPNVFLTGGTPLSWRASVLAACHWSGGIASHLSAAALWGLVGFAAGGRPHVVVAACHLPPRSGIVVHSTDFLPPAHQSRIGRIPVTSIERTLLDLGACARPVAVAAAVDDAVCRNLTTLARLNQCLYMTARKGRRGCGVLRGVLRDRAGTKVLPNSPLETRGFQALLQSSILPRPRLQFEVFDANGDFVARPDFAWPQRRFAVEMDSFKHHGNVEQFRKDRKRLNALTLQGWTVMFGTWDQAERDPEAFLSEVEDGYLSCRQRLPVLSSPRRL